MAADPVELAARGVVKALTLYPEHVECFRLGLRTIETRSQPTRYRGPVVLHAGVRDPDGPAATSDPISRAAMDAIPHGDALTRGAVVLSARLTGCVPINRFPARPMAPNIYEIGGQLILRRDMAQVWPDDIQPQRALGDFTPGRWGLLLEDIAPTTHRCPACWGTGRDPTDGACDDPDCTCQDCPVCDGRRSSDPIPVRGQLGLWEWTWRQAG